LETVARAGVVETGVSTPDDLYYTITTGAARKHFVFDDGTNLTATRIPFATTNGRLTDAAGFTYAAGALATTGAISATTGKFSDLTDGYVPYHKTDADGLVDSLISTDGTKTTITADPGIGTIDV
jgi:hypothetical protein